MFSWLNFFKLNLYFIGYLFAYFTPTPR